MAPLLMTNTLGNFLQRLLDEYGSLKNGKHKNKLVRLIDTLLNKTSKNCVSQ